MGVRTRREGASRSVSRVLYRRRCRRRWRPSICDRRCRRPGAAYPRTRAGSPHTSAQTPRGALLALLRVGFAEPIGSPRPLVVSYTAVSPLPILTDRRSALCGTVPRVTPGGRYPPPCPVEPGLSSTPGAVPRPPDRLAAFSVGQRVTNSAPQGSNSSMAASVSRRHRASRAACARIARSRSGPWSRRSSRRPTCRRRSCPA
jgi:hypothetical protein